MSAPTYNNETYWKRYFPYFPLRARLASARLPIEEWFPTLGTQIHVDRYPKDDSPFTVLIVHGAGGYGRMFAPLAHLLHGAGYEVVAPDLPGYGLSQVAPPLVDYAVWVRILRQMVTAEHARTGRRVVLIGASIGGYLAYLCAASTVPGPIAGLVATTLADPRDAITRAQFARNWVTLRMGLPLLPFFTRFAGRLRLPIKWFTKMAAMSNDAGLSTLVADDRLGGGNSVPLAFMRSLFSICPDVEPEHFSACPVLLVHPAEDRWTPVASSRLVFDRLSAEKYLHLLEGCGHFPIEEPGFSQMEAAVLEFLDRIRTTLDQQQGAQQDNAASIETSRNT